MRSPGAELTTLSTTFRNELQELGRMHTSITAAVPMDEVRLQLKCGKGEARRCADRGAAAPGDSQSRHRARPGEPPAVARRACHQV